MLGKKKTSRFIRVHFYYKLRQMRALFKFREEKTRVYITHVRCRFQRCVLKFFFLFCTHLDGLVMNSNFILYIRLVHSRRCILFYMFFFFYNFPSSFFERNNKKKKKYITKIDKNFHTSVSDTVDSCV